MADLDKAALQAADFGKTALDAADFDKGDGLIPAIVQDAGTHRVLMLGWMDRAALAATLDTRRVTFFSRSRQRLWTKGETSGHVLELVSLELDCDRDTLLVQAIAHGPTCHLQRTSCFPEAPGDVLGALDALIAARVREKPEGSYTTRLLDAGLPRIAQKVGEEGVETALAAVTADDAALAGEAADLLYHLVVLLNARGMGLRDVLDVLASRHAAATAA